MLLKQLLYLTALAREKHFARAAAACDVTQPTLSAGVKQLEETFGVLIVERGQRFHSFTPEGEKILEWAGRMLAEYDNLAQELSGMRKGLTGRLRIGAVPTTLSVIPLLTSPFLQQHPGVSVTVLSRSSIEIQRGLEDFELDVGITYLDNEPLQRVRSIPLYRERYLLFTSVPGLFGDRQAISWREAATPPLCLLTADMQNRRIIDTHFREAGVVPNTILETNSTFTLFSHLRNGEWTTILPHSQLLLTGNIEGVRSIPLVEPESSWSIGIIAPEREPLPPVVRELLSLVEAHNPLDAIKGLQ